MRILLSCLQSLKPHQIPAYGFWRSYFLNGCQEAGIECVEIPNVDWAEGLTYSGGEDLDRWRAKTWEQVLSFAKKEHAIKPFQYFLGYLYPNQVEVSAIRELKKYGIPCVNFFCDNVREFSAIPHAYHDFDLHWVPEFEALQLYKRANLPFIHAPMPCWIPEEFRNIPDAETEPPTFIGSSDILRRDLLGRALSLGADFIIRGPGWKVGEDQASHLPKRNSLKQVVKNQIGYLRDKGFDGTYIKFYNQLFPIEPLPIDESVIKSPVFGTEYFRVTREAIVTIGINRVPTSRALNRNPITYSRLRDIEAPMLGACYLAEWTEGLEQLYEIGKEIDCFRSPEEMRAKIDELRGDSPRRQSLRAHAQRRALTDHTVKASLRQIQKWLNL